MTRFTGPLTWRKFAVVYVMIITVGVAAAFFGERYLHVDGRRIIFAGGALLFLAAALRRPETLFLVVRNAGWFSGIENDRTMRIILVVFAVLLALGAAFLNYPSPAAG